MLACIGQGPNPYRNLELAQNPKKARRQTAYLVASNQTDILQ
jgi:hypothetical protein